MSVNLLFAKTENAYNLIELFKLHMGPEEQVICADIHQNTPTKFICNYFYVVSSCPHTFVNDIKNIAAAHKVTMIIPLDHISRYLFANIVINNIPIGCPLDEITFNYEKLFNSLMTTGIDIPTIIPYTELYSEVDRQDVIGLHKTKDQLHSFLFNNPTDVDYFNNKKTADNYIFIQDLTGVKYTTLCLKNYDNNIIFTGTYIKNSHNIYKVVDDQRFDRHPIFDTLRFHGLLSVQFIDCDGKIYVTDVNRVVNEEIILFQFAGVPIINWLMRLFSGEVLKYQNIKPAINVEVFRTERLHWMNI